MSTATKVVPTKFPALPARGPRRAHEAIEELRERLDSYGFAADPDTPDRP
jgi:hypothetical protein